MVFGGNYVSLNSPEGKPWYFVFRQYALLSALLVNSLVFFGLCYSLYEVRHDGKNSAKNLPAYKSLSIDTFESELQPIDFLNASAVFAEVHNALKQKNADVNPISVSYIPAYIPEGTLLYHSNHNGKVPTTYEWVAMDYEFSYNFAHFDRGKPNNGFPGSPGASPKPPKASDDGFKKPHGHPHMDFSGPSTLLTFQVTKPLDKLILLGGASASKTTTGEMDTQYILSQIENYDDFDERIGSDKICEWGRKHGGLDGLVRLEIGFEIVICDFSEKLELVSNVTLRNVTDMIDFPREVFTDEPSDDLNAQRSGVLDTIESVVGFEHYQAGGRVYDGDKRVLMDFSKMVTPLNKTFIDADPYLRRIDNLTADLKSEIIDEVAEMLATPNDPYSSTNWQLITDNIVDKFAPLLVNLNSSFALYDAHKSYQTLGTNLTSWSYNYIRRYLSDPETELVPHLRKMAIWDYAHPLEQIQSEADFLIWNSVTVVQSAIVDAIYECFLLSKTLLSVLTEKSLPDDIEEQIASTRNRLATLLAELNWAYYYQCSQKCKSDELCFIPTWGPAPLSWSKRDMIGFYIDESGKKRISKELQCINYNTLLEAGRGW
ncbi:hypothetical protein OGAPHI_004178 [Ogataea philodendri]|uniref:Uncharacterized protein n=1 Tax=Ogataea philodendri TaxID=1378263 RepID=A0A9P8T566_9ASCO|nr:uncharacterized protein OGAPHI_004178 [Ogataea philodendri]KAH3665989.1 hypothetical protein OGAPHI_004178 [Ogataea philodendri]